MKPDERTDLPLRPPATSNEHMTPIGIIKTAQHAKLVDKVGKPVNIGLHPPLSGDEIDSLQKRIGLPLPEELRTLLTFCAGIDGLLEIDFTGASMAFEQDELFPNGLPIAADGFGNFWVLDITPQTSVHAPVFFACHDAPVILYQSADLSSFLTEMFRMYGESHDSLLTAVSDDTLFDVWRTNPGLMDQPTASQSPDNTLRIFAQSLAAHYKIVDLRNVDPGMGFSWGRYGPQTELRRHGFERIFGYAKPTGNQGMIGLLAKLFRRKSECRHGRKSEIDLTNFGRSTVLFKYLVINLNATINLCCTFPNPASQYQHWHS